MIIIRCNTNRTTKQQNSNPTEYHLIVYQNTHITFSWIRMPHEFKWQFGVQCKTEQSYILFIAQYSLHIHKIRDQWCKNICRGQSNAGRYLKCFIGYENLIFISKYMVASLLAYYILTSTINNWGYEVWTVGMLLCIQCLFRI